MVAISFRPYVYIPIFTRNMIYLFSSYFTQIPAVSTKNSHNDCGVTIHTLIMHTVRCILLRFGTGSFIVLHIFVRIDLAHFTGTMVCDCRRVNEAILMNMGKYATLWMII